MRAAVARNHLDSGTILGGINDTVVTPQLNLLTRWRNDVYTFVEPQFTIDWERGGALGLTIELEIGKLVSKNVGIWARPGIGIIHNDLPQVYNWNIEIGMRYVF